MSWWNNLTSRVSAAYNALTGKALIPRDDNGYEGNSSRRQRYAINEAYADNDMYTSSDPTLISRRLQGNRYSKIRAIMNACPRVVDLFAYFVYIGNIDMEDLGSGAIPLKYKNKNIEAGIRNGFKWSNWNTNKELYVRNGATYGDTAIKVVDDREKQKVYMEPLHPSRIKDISLDSRGNVIAVVIEYQRFEDVDLAVVTPQSLELLADKTYTYTEIITKDYVTLTGETIKGKFRTFKDGKPFAFYTDMNGNPVQEWDNEYGFVPVVWRHHINTGLKSGMSAFQKVISKIDELNDGMSLLRDQIRKIVIPLLKAIGVAVKKNIDGSTSTELGVVSVDTGRDSIPILHLPNKDSDLRPIEANALDIAAVDGNNSIIDNEIMADLPILALQQIRSGGGDLTEPGINAAYADANASVNSARANYDSGTVAALQMLLSIGGYNGYEGFEGITLESYASGDLEMEVKNRAVIEVPMTKGDKVTALAAINNMNSALQEIALKELGIDEVSIQKVVDAAEEAARNAVRGLAQHLFPTGEDDNEDEPKALGQGAKKPLQLAERVAEPA